MTSQRVDRPLPASAAGLLLLGVVLSAFSLRTAVTSITPLLDEVSGAIGFGPAVAGVLGMVPTAMFAAFGILTPALVRRFGLEHMALASMVLATAGLVTRSLADNVAVLLLTSSCALAGMGIGNVVIPPVIQRFFPARVATLSTAYITVLQLGTLVPPLVAVPLANAHGWRISLGVWAIASAAAVIPWLLLILRSGRKDPHDVPANAATPTGRIWRSPVAWSLALMFAMTSLNTYALFTWLPKILTSAGRDAAYGGVMVSLFAGMGLVSAMIAPQLAARLPNPAVVVIGSVAMFVIGYAGLLWAPQTATPIWVIACGLGPTTFPLALTLINLRTRTAAGSAALSGFSQGVGYTLACLGPVVFGLLHDAFGGWTASFGFLATTLVVMLFAGLQASRPRMLEDTLH
ncbi:MFS transporter [Yimella sp. cx-51]|uniref:CynX/NimT family MFS transporter n=1 Tax=Yimella sp. cx-51 TaxID=2770551 RepID=UPI001AD8985A|nr:MFS transporter [Yimella sp. cx-51]QTH37560.1 MFS transporter [Yimella sp. cx-51]